jgi:hypothetical protein
MRIKGAEFKKWRDADMPRSYGFANLGTLPIDPETDDVPDDAVVDTAALGRLLWVDDPIHDPTGGRGLALATRIRRWQTSQLDLSLMVRRGDGRAVDDVLGDAGITIKKKSRWGGSDEPKAQSDE